MQKKTAIILFSGGLDSSTILAFAKEKGFKLIALSFNYEQKNKKELTFAKSFAKDMGAKHKIIKIDPKIFSSSQSSLVNKKQKVEKANAVGATEIPSTYVPARNLLFLSHAISYAESICSTDIFLGVNVLDYGNYPDCRPEFIKHVEIAATLSSKNCQENSIEFKLHTPIINMNKAEIIKLGTKLGVDYSKTISCYSPTENGLSCGHCLSCSFRKKGFLEASLEDPTLYVKS